MEKIDENINKFLPFGESLRAILQHSSIKESDIRRLLNIKGIYVDSVDDEVTFPLLLSNLLSPFEFQHIKEKIKSREDREKTITRTLDWKSDKTLIAAIPDNFNIQEIVKTTFPRYDIVGTPNFSMIDKNPDRIILDFICESQNYSKEWYRSDNRFKAQITLEKVATKDNKIQLQIIHTSPETTEISNKVVKKLENHFKANNFMEKNSEIKKILFKDFTNEERIDFFLNFTSGNDVFNFERVSNIDISHDLGATLPDEINWLELGKVKELNINGDNLHNIHFIKEKELHKYMELSELEIVYSFSLPIAEGNCRITFGFPNYFPKRIPTIEFVVDIPKINLKENSHASMPYVRTELLKAFEIMKTEKYDYIISKYLSKQLSSN